MKEERKNGGEGRRQVGVELCQAKMKPAIHLLCAILFMQRLLSNHHCAHLVSQNGSDPLISEKNRSYYRVHGIQIDRP